MRRVRVTFWTLVVMAVVSTGVLMDALGWRSGPVAGITIAVSGATSALAIALAVRILIVLSRDGERGPACDSAARIKLTSGDRRNATSEPEANAPPRSAIGPVGAVNQSTIAGDAVLRGVDDSVEGHSPTV